MAEFKPDVIIDELHGAIVPKGVIFRQKRLRNSSGKCIKKCKKEAYKVENPRDFDRKPQTGNELVNRQAFQEAIYRTHSILAAAKPENNPTPEQIAELKAWQARFEAQIPGVRGGKPDSEAPLYPQSLKQKRYYQLNTFIRAIIYHQLKSQA